MQLTWTSSNPENVNHNANCPPHLPSSATVRNSLCHQASRHSHISTSNHYSAPDVIFVLSNLGNSPHLLPTKTMSSISFAHLARSFIHALFSHQPSHHLALKVSPVFYMFSLFPSPALHLSLPLRFYMWRDMRGVVFCRGRSLHPRFPIVVCSTHCGMR